MKELILFIKGTRFRKSSDLSYTPNIIANVQDVDTHDVPIDWARIQLFSSSIQCSVSAQPKAPPPWTGEVTQYDVHVGFMNQALRIQSNRYILSTLTDVGNTVVKHSKYCYFPCKYCRIPSNCKDYCLISKKLAYLLLWSDFIKFKY